MDWMGNIYRQLSNMRRTLIGNKMVDHSDLVGASPVGVTPVFMLDFAELSRSFNKPSLLYMD